MHAAVDVQQLERAAQTCRGRVRAHDFAKRGAIDVRNSPQIDNKVQATAPDELPNCVSKLGGTVLDGNSAVDVEDRDAPDRSFRNRHDTPRSDTASR